MHLYLSDRPHPSQGAFRPDLQEFCHELVAERLTRPFPLTCVTGYPSESLRPVYHEIDKVFAANQDLHDYREDFPWFSGFIGDIDSEVMLLAENPSLRGLKKASKLRRLQDFEMQWGVTSGDKILRKALVRAGLKDGPPMRRNGWHCYITNVVKMADVASEWSDRSEEDKFRIAKLFAPVLQEELRIMKPRVIVVMGKRVASMFCRLRDENVLEIPRPKSGNRIRIERVLHYAYFNNSGPKPKKKREFYNNFKRIGSLVPRN